MGSIVSKSNQDDSVPTPTLKNLTPEQVKIIQKTWEIPSAKPLDSGEKILFAFLEQYPHNMEKFLAFRNTPLLLLRGTPGFRSHASKIMNVFAVAIDSLDKENGLTEIQKIVAEVGKSHSKRKLSKRSFIELRTVIVDILMEVCNLDDDGAEAWNNLLDIVYHIIFECFDGNYENFAG